MTCSCSVLSLLSGSSTIAASWGFLARAEKRRVQTLPRRGTAKRRGAAQAPPEGGAEASGVERGARAGKSPHENEAAVLSRRPKGLKE